MKKSLLLMMLFLASLTSIAQNVGIGTTTPSEKLEVNGSIKITDGLQGNGKVLISDANGKGEWKQILRKDTLSISPLATVGTGSSCIAGPLIAYFPTPVTGGQLTLSVHLPTGATITQIMVYFVDNNSVKNYTISFIQMPQGIPFPSPIASFTTGGTPSTAVQNAPLTISTPITINNSNNFYFITMTGDFQTTSEGFCGVRIAYTYPVNN